MYSYLPFLIALLVSFTSAQSNFTAISGTGPGGPIQNASYFEEYNQSPNATGTGYLSGANTSYSDPRRLQSATWDTRINVTEVPWTNNQTVTNTVISLSTSDNVFASNSSWETCVVLLTNVPRNVTVEGQDDKGNCKTLFSDDCLKNYTLAISTARASASARNATGVCGGISFAKIPSQCTGSILPGSVAQGVYPNAILKLKPRRKITNAIQTSLQTRPMAQHGCSKAVMPMIQPTSLSMKKLLPGYGQ